MYAWERQRAYAYMCVLNGVWRSDDGIRAEFLGFERCLVYFIGAVISTLVLVTVCQVPLNTEPSLQPPQRHFKKSPFNWLLLSSVFLNYMLIRLWLFSDIFYSFLSTA